MTRYLKFAFADDVDLKSRVDWYDEIKTPLLTSLILCDSGEQALTQRSKELHSLSLEKCYSVQQQTSFAEERLTLEERFVRLVQSEKSYHAKAKMLILQFIGLVLESKQKLGGKSKKRTMNGQVFDPDKTSVQDIFSILTE